MKTILQIGFGPLGIQTAKFIAQRKNVKTIAVVDVNDKIIGKSLDKIDASLSSEVKIFGSLKSAIAALGVKPDVAIITTVSSLQKILPQIEVVAKYGIPVISTCEELFFPWDLQPELSKKLDDICKVNNIACLGTGVNPGFLMDYLPSVLCSVCQNIEQIVVERVQDASKRRIPFQNKIGAGLTLKDFKEKEKTGTLRHVGLKESVYFIANSVGFYLDEVTESLDPVIAEKDYDGETTKIKKGNALGVQQIAHGYEDGVCKVKHIFKAAIGEERSYDKITVKGSPSFSSEIDGGINGDIATCAIAINSIQSILKAPPGLHTMADIGLPGYMA